MNKLIKPSFYSELGEFRNAARHGKGTMWYANGDIYCGNWDRLCQSGPGKI